MHRQIGRPGKHPGPAAKAGSKEGKRPRGGGERLSRPAEGGVDPEARRRLALAVKLDNILLNDDRLRRATGLGSTAFFYIVAALEGDAGKGGAALPARHAAGTGGALDRGGRRPLETAHMAALALYHMRTGVSQEALSSMFGADQAEALQSIREILDIMAGTRIIPTVRVMMDEMAAAPKDKAIEHIGGAVSMDWLRVKIERPADRGHVEGASRGGARAATCRALIGCAATGTIVFRGPLIEGSGGGAEYLRRHLPGMGSVADSLLGGGAPAGDRIAVNLDGGLRGAEKALRGADVRMPRRISFREGAGQERMSHGQRQAGDRAAIEANLAGIRSYRILGGVFRGSVADLEKALTVATGLVNLNRMAGGAGGPGDSRRGGTGGQKGGAGDSVGGRGSDSGAIARKEEFCAGRRPL